MLTGLAARVCMLTDLAAHLYMLTGLAAHMYMLTGLSAHVYMLTGLAAHVYMLTDLAAHVYMLIGYCPVRGGVLRTVHGSYVRSFMSFILHPLLSGLSVRSWGLRTDRPHSNSFAFAALKTRRYLILDESAQVKDILNCTSWL